MFIIIRVADVTPIKMSKIKKNWCPFAFRQGLQNWFRSMLCNDLAFLNHWIFAKNFRASLITAGKSGCKKIRMLFFLPLAEIHEWWIYMNFD